MKNEMNLVKWMMSKASKAVHVNPENTAEKVEEMTWIGNLRNIVNFEGAVDGWSVKVTTDAKPGGHCATNLTAWRWA
jgi:hypothetical protein